MLKIFLEFLDNPNITPRFMDGINEVWLNKVKWKKNECFACRAFVK